MLLDKVKNYILTNKSFIIKKNKIWSFRNIFFIKKRIIKKK